MTEEQLEFFSAQTRHAVHKYVRGAVIGFLILLCGIAWALHVSARDNSTGRRAIVNSTRAVAVDSCNGRFQDRQGLRNLLISAELQIPAAVKKGEITQAQANRAVSFYNEQLAKLVLPDCRKALLVITDNPAQSVIIPQPLYPFPNPDRESAHDSIFP